MPLSETQFEDKYQIKPLPSWTMGLKTTLEKLAQYSPEKITDNGQTIQFKNLINGFLIALSNYAILKNTYESFYKLFYDTPMRSDLNTTLNPFVVRYAVLCRDFENTLNPVAVDLKNEAEIALAHYMKTTEGIGAIPLIIPAIGGLISLIVGLWKAPEIIKFYNEGKQIDYDRQTMTEIMLMINSGKSDDEILKKFLERKSGRPSNFDPAKMAESTIESIFPSIATGPILKYGLIALGGYFIYKKLKK